MARQKKERIVELIPKTDIGKQRLSYHGNFWLLRQEAATIRGSRIPGPYIAAMSKDGKSLMWVHAVNDPDFNVRERQ
jgi:hypothetical protein